MSGFASLYPTYVLNVTVEEGLSELATLCANEVSINGQGKFNQIPQPRASVAKLIEAARVRMPEALPSRGVIVTTKKNCHLNVKQNNFKALRV